MKSRRQYLFLICTLTAGLVLSFFVSDVSAHKGATGIIRIRMDAMSGIGDHMKKIAAMLKATDSMNHEAISGHADGIRENAENFSGFFAEPTDDPISEAAPAIWEQPGEFSRLTNALVDHAASLSDLAKNESAPEAMQAAFGAMAATCRDCHEVFRIKKH